MKKILAFIAVICPVIFAASCKKEKTETPPQEQETFTIALTQSNVAAAGLNYDYIVAVNNPGKTIEIIADYLDKDELAALEVTFTGLPEGVSTEYVKTFNYSNGASQTVGFVKGESKIEYTLSASCADPDPRFVTITVADIDAISGTVKIKGGNLSSLPVVFTVSPSDTKVSVEGHEVASGVLIDFSDKVNGVTFTLSCAGVENEFNIKAQTTGVDKVHRVWGKYTSPVTIDNDGWWGNKVTDELNAIRNIAMDDKYIYLSRSQKDENRGVYAVSITDPDNVVFMSQDGLNADGVHHSSAIATVDNGSESYVLVSNLVNAKGQHLYIYRYASVSSNAEVVLDYILPEAVRLGDKMTVEGDWNSGKIWFHDYASGMKAYCFEISNGRISSSPTVVDYSVKAGGIGALHKTPEGNYIWCGTGVGATVYGISGTTATHIYTVSTADFATPLHGATVIEFNEEKYLGYVVLRNSFLDGQFRLTALTGEDLVSSLQAPGGNYVFGLGDPTENDITALKNGNGTGDGVFRVVDGHHYYAAYVTGAGLSLFELK